MFWWFFNQTISLLLFELAHNWFCACTVSLYEPYSSLFAKTGTDQNVFSSQYFVLFVISESHKYKIWNISFTFTYLNRRRHFYFPCLPTSRPVLPSPIEVHKIPINHKLINFTNLNKYLFLGFFCKPKSRKSLTNQPLGSIRANRSSRHSRSRQLSYQTMKQKM